MKRIVILGAGGHAHVVADIVAACGDTVAAFLDDDPDKAGTEGPISAYERFPDCEFIIGIGNAAVREKYAKLPVRWYTAIHPSAVISPSAAIGRGTVVMPLAVVNCRAAIGEHCIINTGAIVEHDNQIGDFAHISVGAKLGGTVTVGRAAWIGIGAVVRNDIRICGECMVGAGAVVVKDIPERCTAVGNPARPIKYDN